jgi:exportin-T
VPVVRFYALQVVERGVRAPGGPYAALDPEGRSQVRGALLRWLLAAAPAAWGAEPTWVRNKFALIFALIVKTDCPELWPSAFEDLLEALRGSAATLDALFRVLDDVTEEIIMFRQDRTSAEVKHNTLIKDTMRRNGTLAALAELWAAVLRGGGEDPPLQAACLNTMKHYIGWIDVDLIANDTIVPMLFAALNSVPLRFAACECIYELVDKGLPDASKLDMLQSLHVLEAITSVNISDDVEFAGDVAQLVGTVGCALLTCWQAPEVRSRPASRARIARSRPLTSRGERTRRLTSHPSAQTSRVT